jgi:hypothetical protein
LLLVQGAALAAAAAGADGALGRLARVGFGWRQPLAAAVAGTALLAPVLGAGWWVLGQTEPLLQRRGAPDVPAYIADAQRTAQAPRTLTISGAGAGLAVHLSRGPGLYVGQDAVAPGPPTELVDLAARLVTEPAAQDVAALARHGVGFVLLSRAGPDAVTAVDGAPGLVRASAADRSDTAWRLDAPAGPVRLAPATSDDPGAARVLAVPGGDAESLRASAPAGSGPRLLTLGESADDGWAATLSGDPVPARVVDGWAQGFVLPAGAGEVVVEHESARAWWLAGQGLVLLLALVLLTPGRRRPDATR